MSADRAGAVLRPRADRRSLVQELLEPLGDLIDDRQYGGSFNGVFGDARIGLVRHTASQAAYRDINVTVTN